MKRFLSLLTVLVMLTVACTAMAESYGVNDVKIKENISPDEFCDALNQVEALLTGGNYSVRYEMSTTTSGNSSADFYFSEVDGNGEWILCYGSMEDDFLAGVVQFVNIENMKAAAAQMYWINAALQVTSGVPASNALENAQNTMNYLYMSWGMNLISATEWYYGRKFTLMTIDATTLGVVVVLKNVDATPVATGNLNQLLGLPEVITGWADLASILPEELQGTRQPEDFDVSYDEVISGYDSRTYISFQFYEAGQPGTYQVNRNLGYEYDEENNEDIWLGAVETSCLYYDYYYDKDNEEPWVADLYISWWDDENRITLVYNWYEERWCDEETGAVVSVSELPFDPSDYVLNIDWQD